MILFYPQGGEQSPIRVYQTDFKGDTPVESHLHLLLAWLVLPHGNQAVQLGQHTNAVWSGAQQLHCPQGCKIRTSRHPCKLHSIPTAGK